MFSDCENLIKKCIVDLGAENSVTANFIEDNTDTLVMKLHDLDYLGYVTAFTQIYDGNNFSLIKENFRYATNKLMEPFHQMFPMLEKSYQEYVKVPFEKVNYGNTFFVYAVMQEEIVVALIKIRDKTQLTCIDDILLFRSTSKTFRELCDTEWWWKEYGKKCRHEDDEWHKESCRKVI